MFRGLRLGNSPWPTRLVIVYAIDCENMDDHDYQEQVYLSTLELCRSPTLVQVFRELHGMLGEGKGQFCQGLCLNLHLINPKSMDNVDMIRQRLKVHGRPLQFVPVWKLRWPADPADATAKTRL